MRSNTYNKNRYRTISRHGLTLAECLFAMAIMLVGLVGIAAMVPFAGRQAADSYSIVQTLAAGQNTIAVAKSSQVFRPSTTSPWQFIDDNAATAVDSRDTYFVSAERLYQQLYVSSLPAGHNQNQRYVAANTALGTSFCMDPNFWGHQARYNQWLGASHRKVLSNDWGYYRRTRFPFYNETYPVNYYPFSTGATATTPRLARVSLRDPMGSDVNGNNGWLREAASKIVSSSGGGDVTKEVAQVDKSFGPLRGFASSSNSALVSSIQAGSGASNASWLATIVPTDETPFAEPATADLPFYPESFDLSVVVFSKRDVRELVFENATEYDAFDTDGIPATSERIADVGFLNPLEASSSSTFSITLRTDERVGLRCKVGDWIMLSRYRRFQNTARGIEFSRQQHEWYRLISVTAEETSTGPFGNTIVACEVRVSGKPWGWSLSEGEWFRDQGMTSLPNLNLMPPAVATLVPNVINVYQRTLKAGGL
jgi:Tfp pilus assembly protein PilV